MAQNITLLGASYSDVPSVELPKTGGGTAQFDDTTIASNAASASDITSGKLAFVNGELVTGTASGGGATLITKSITANGTYNASSDNADGYSSVTVNVSGGGGGGGNMSDPIRFFDYDGTLVASYSAAPSSLPSVPSHTGLTNGTWNYTLQQVTTQFNAMGTCDVGANYETVSGATEIDIEFVDSTRLHPYLSLAVNGTVSIDWGDGSTPDTSTGTSVSTRKADIHHEYAAVGKYTITIEPSTGTKYALLGTSSYFLLNGDKSSSSSVNLFYAQRVVHVRVGKNCAIASYAFYNCRLLESASIPSGSVTYIGQNAFRYCYNIKGICVPSTITSLNSYNFSDCYALDVVSIPPVITTIPTYCFNNSSTMDKVSIPSSITTISQYAFNANPGIASLTIPSSVTSIGASAFYGCYGIAEYHFKPTAPPTLSNTNAFTGIQSDCKIYVPRASLDTYKTTNNWSTYASYMVGE